MASPLLVPIYHLTNQLTLNDLEAVKAHVISLMSGFCSQPVPESSEPTGKIEAILAERKASLQRNYSKSVPHKATFYDLREVKLIEAILEANSSLSSRISAIEARSTMSP